MNSIEEEIKKLQREIIAIQERNLRVEADKAWETSGFRIFFILVITYVIAVLVLYLIGAQNIFLSALVPTMGFFLSIQSLPVLKKWWIKRFFHGKNNI